MDRTGIHRFDITPLSKKQHTRIVSNQSRGSTLGLRPASPLFTIAKKNKKMVGLPAISNSLQEIAAFGIKEHVRETRRYGDWFHLLLFLASQSWNISIEGEDGILPTIPKEFNERRKELGIKKKDIETNFITTDLVEITRRFVEIKEKEYPFDRRFIHAIEFTPEGNLRVYSA